MEKKNSIRKEDFLEWTKSVWTFPSVSAKRIGHPAPFPEELPHRLIQLYTFIGDVVLESVLWERHNLLKCLEIGETLYRLRY